MAEIKNSEKNVTTLTLCGVQGCCPTVEINHESKTVVITDDYGGKVTLTNEQWRDALSRANLDA